MRVSFTRLGNLTVTNTTPLSLRPRLVVLNVLRAKALGSNHSVNVDQTRARDSVMRTHSLDIFR